MDVETDTDGESITIEITVDDERLYREIPLAIIQRSAQIRGNESATNYENLMATELHTIGADLLETFPTDVSRESNTIEFSVSSKGVLQEVVRGIGVRSSQVHGQDRDTDLDSVLRDTKRAILAAHTPE